MLKEINIALLVDSTTGGWPSFTTHLIYGIRELGIDPFLFRITKRTETKPRPFAPDIMYHNISLQVAEQISKRAPTIIAAVGSKRADQAEVLLRQNAIAVIHDPTELTQSIREVLTMSSQPVVIIRRKNKDHLTGLEVAEILHPYKQAKPGVCNVNKHAVSFSRLDWDKNIHIIVEANMMLPDNQQVVIYGSENRLYTHHKLMSLDSNWARNYKGGWSSKTSTHYPVHIARCARYAIDLSVIKGDGGGTQYTFLEAFDARTPLIIHNAWLTGEADIDEIAPAISAQVSSAADLVHALQSGVDYNHEAAEHILQAHSAEKQAKNLLRVLGVPTV